METKKFIVEVNDFTGKIKEVGNKETAYEDMIKDLANETTVLAKDVIMQIATYVFKLNEEFDKVKVPNSYYCELKAYRYGKVGLKVRENTLLIGFGHMASEPNSVLAELKDEEIVVRNLDNGQVSELCSNWQYLKPDFEKMIPGAIKENQRRLELRLSREEGYNNAVKNFTL